MSNRIPDFLKLHVEPEHDELATAAVPELERLCSSFFAVTGLPLVVRARPRDDQLAFAWLDDSAPTLEVSLGQRQRGNDGNVSTADARELESALTQLVNRFCQTRRALRNREAELAAAVPVVSMKEDGLHLAERLEAVLRGAADMLHCTGAGLYMLDDGTTALKLRAHHGLHADALVRPARRLELATADVEALAGHAVVVENTDVMSHWNVPERCGSAICVPVASATTILGTLWFFRKEHRDFSPAEQNLAEMTAGRLASDLERSVLIQEVRGLRASVQGVGELVDSAPQASRVPPVVDGWDVAQSDADGQTTGDCCQWYLAESDKLHLSVGSARGDASGELTSLVLKNAVAAHSQHDPSVVDLFRHVSQTLWSASPATNVVSLFHAVLDPTCGVAHYGLTGGVFAYLLRPHVWEPLLADNIPLGEDVNIPIHARRQVLMPGDILVAISSPHATRDHQAEGPMNQAAEKLLRNTHLAANDLANLAARKLAEDSVSDPRLAVLVAKRKESGWA